MHTRRVLVAALVLLAGACSSGRSSSVAEVIDPWSATAAPATPLRPGEHFQVIGMPRPFTPVAPKGGTDEYRCFLLDPHLTNRMYLTGSQFLPSNSEIVHHAIVFRVAADDVAAAQQRDAADPGDGWTCFSGTGIRGGRAGDQLGLGSAWIAAWAPGATETLLGARTGYLMEPGSQVVLQVHYNLLATAGRAAGPDRSGLRLRLADGATKFSALQTTLLAAPVELPCAAGESGWLCSRDNAVVDVGHRFGATSMAVVSGLAALCSPTHLPVAGTTQHCDHRVRRSGTIYAVAGHMHLLGRSITVELNPGTPRATMLLKVDAYNFDNQAATVLPRPVHVKAGDTYRVTCTHDATLRAKLPELKPLPPRYVVWGEGTSDEMCLGIVIWA